MGRRKFTTLLLALCAAFVLSVSLPSCGTLHSHWGVEHEYDYDFPDGGHHHRPKPKKHKKHKKHKPKKHHKKHHHDD